MSVSVRIPTILRTYTGGSAEVTADPGTLREVIAGLDAAYPGLAGRIVDDTGNLRRFVNVYVGDEDVRFAQGLETPVPAGAQVQARQRVVSVEAKPQGTQVTTESQVQVVGADKPVLIYEGIFLYVK